MSQHIIDVAEKGYSYKVTVNFHWYKFPDDPYETIKIEKNPLYYSKYNRWTTEEELTPDWRVPKDIKEKLNELLLNEINSIIEEYNEPIQSLNKLRRR